MPKAHRVPGKLHASEGIRKDNQVHEPYAEENEDHEPEELLDAFDENPHGLAANLGLHAIHGCQGNRFRR